MSTIDEQRVALGPDTTRVVTPRDVPDGAPAVTADRSATKPTPDASAVAGPPPAAVRASDQEREVTVTLLHQAMSEGRLALSETEDRITTAYASTYRHELPALLADLPDSTDRTAPSAVGAPDWSQLWVLLVWRARVTLRGRRGPAATTPTAAQCRAAGLLVTLTALWLFLCAFFGAGVLA